MGLYAFFLAGSNYFAPVICGFIAQYQDWRWVFYWPSIFIAGAFVFLFFFMEETNYVRGVAVPVGGLVEKTTSSSLGTASDVGETVPGDPEKGGVKTSPAVTTEEERVVGVFAYSKKSYVQKLSLLGPKQMRNNMLRRAWQTVYYLSWPVIFYAGYVLYSST